MNGGPLTDFGGYHETLHRGWFNASAENKNFMRSLSIQCHNSAETFDMEVGVRAVGTEKGCWEEPVWISLLPFARGF